MGQFGRWFSSEKSHIFASRAVSIIDFIKNKAPRVSFSHSLLLGPMGGAQVGGFKSGTPSVVYIEGVLAKTLLNTMRIVRNPG